jgi:hypothetical protein
MKVNLSAIGLTIKYAVVNNENLPREKLKGSY